MVLGGEEVGLEAELEGLGGCEGEGEGLDLLEEEKFGGGEGGMGSTNFAMRSSRRPGGREEKGTGRAGDVPWHERS